MESGGDQGCSAFVIGKPPFNNDKGDVEKHDGSKRGEGRGRKTKGRELRNFRDFTNRSIPKPHNMMRSLGSPPGLIGIRMVYISPMGMIRLKKGMITCAYKILPGEI